MASAIFYIPFMTPEGLFTSYERYNQIIRDVAKKTGVLLIEGERHSGYPCVFRGFGPFQ